MAHNRRNGYVTRVESAHCLVWGDPDHLWIKPGQSKTTGPGNYKIPCVDDIPREMNVTLVKASDDSRAVHSSRGVGEPPILLASSVVFAIQDAIKAARLDAGITGHFELPVRLPLHITLGNPRFLSKFLHL